MATFSLVHGAWHGGWAWDALRAELEARGHTVAAPDLPCDDVRAGAAEYAALVPPADVAVGHSLGGLTIPLVEAHLRVFLCALWPGLDRRDAFVPGFGDARIRDELGRSMYPIPPTAPASCGIHGRPRSSRGCSARRLRSTRTRHARARRSTSSARAMRRCGRSGNGGPRSGATAPSSSTRAIRRC